MSKNPRFESEILTDQGVSSVPNPASGSHKFINRSGILYSKNSSGTETLVGSGLDSPGKLDNYTLTTSVSTNALTVALKTKAGTDPDANDLCAFGFRSATLTAGTYAIVQATVATSITVASGATLGSVSGVDTYAYVYALNNAGTVELAISLKKFDEKATQSTTALSGSSTSATTLYSTTARSNVAIRLIGRLKFNETTAGLWATNMSEVSLGSTFITGGGLAPAQGVAIPAGYSGYRLIDGPNVVSCSNGGVTTVATLTLTPGTWSMTARAFSVGNASLTNISMGIATTTNTSTGWITGYNYASTTQTTTDTTIAPIADYVVTITATTTYYLTFVRTGAAGNVTATLSATLLG